jgi:hypothetical protein
VLAVRRCDGQELAQAAVKKEEVILYITDLVHLVCCVIVALSKSYVTHFDDVIHFCHHTVNETKCDPLRWVTFESDSGTSLVSISMPASVKLIGHRAVANCRFLTSVLFDAGSLLPRMEKNGFSNSGPKSGLITPRNHCPERDMTVLMELFSTSGLDDSLGCWINKEQSLKESESTFTSSPSMGLHRSSSPCAPWLIARSRWRK